MKAVAAMNPRVKDPVYHVVLSWPASESPTDEQAFACGAHALKAVGMDDHQYVFAIHRDTDNVHLHIAVNRVHPDTLKAVYPDRDFFKLDRAMRELELRFGWRHDKGPYAVYERHGVAVIDWAKKDQNTKEKAPAAAKDMERFSGQESFFSYVRGEPRKAIVALFKQNGTWQSLHRELARFGLEIRSKGQGMAIFDVRDETVTPIKASDMHEELSKSRLERRLGPYQPLLESPADEPLQCYDKHREIKRDPTMREEHRQARAAARRDLLAQYDIYKVQFVRKRLDPILVKARYAAIRTEARQRREEIRRSLPDAAARKALYSVIAFETLRSRERLRRQIASEREALKWDPANHRLSYREWVERQAAAGAQPAVAQMRAWAYAEKRKARELAQIDQDRSVAAIRHGEPADPLASRLGHGIEYRVKRDGAVAYQMDGHRVFVDQGRIILIQDDAVANEQAILGALRLARQKFDGPLDLTGSDEFKQRAIGVIVRHKIDATLKDSGLDEIRRQLAVGARKHKQPGSNQR
jgi:hypothetical protein